MGDGWYDACLGVEHTAAADLVRLLCLAHYLSVITSGGRHYQLVYTPSQVGKFGDASKHPPGVGLLMRKDVIEAIGLEELQSSPLEGYTVGYTSAYVPKHVETLLNGMLRHAIVTQAAPGTMLTCLLHATADHASIWSTILNPYVGEPFAISQVQEYSTISRLMAALIDGAIDAVLAVDSLIEQGRQSRSSGVRLYFQPPFGLAYFQWLHSNITSYLVSGRQ